MKKSTQGVFSSRRRWAVERLTTCRSWSFAQKPKLRKNVMGAIYESKDLGPVRVVAFSGRESDAPYGIWVLLAEQLNKKRGLQRLLLAFISAWADSMD